MTDLLVSSAGGHLRQMWEIRSRLHLSDDVLWAVAPTEQSRSLLRGEVVVDLPSTPSRDLKGALRLLPLARQILSESGVSRVISTGALPAVPFFVQARLRGLPSYYIESATRTAEPSLTGQLVSRIPGVQAFSQYPSWAQGRWRYGGSVLDRYGPGPDRGGPGRIRRAVVTFGVEKFGFRRAAEALLQVLPPDAEVLWQTGYTDVSGLGIRARDFVPLGELQAAMAAADVVIAHSGTGSALTALDVGKSPVLLPRRASLGEHIDDHQSELAKELQRRGLATWCDVERLDLRVLTRAAATSVVPVVPPPFLLTDRGALQPL